MNQYQCSVVIIQYNPNWEKLKATLNSIVCQKDCNYEIIVTDDGSKCTCFDKVREYFEENNFKNFQLVENKTNAGTVKNVISGIKVAQGKYVRVIAPGDMLYSDTTLHRIVDFMDEHHAKEVFGKMVFYEYKNGKVNLIPNQVPFALRPYKKKNTKSIKKHLLVLGDNISGASYTWDREYYLECLMRIHDKVIYLEDCVNAYTVYDRHNICFMDEYVTWYEYGMGISTSKNNKWTAILIKDWIAFLEEMNKRYPNESNIKKAKLYYQMSQSGKILNKIVKNLLFLERYLFGRFAPKMVKDKAYGLIEKESVLRFFDM